MAKAKTKRFKQPKYDTLQAASSGMQIPIEILKAAKRAGCPNFVHGRVIIAGLQDWITEHDDQLRSQITEPGSLRDKKLTEEIRKLRIANDAKEGRLIARSFVVETHAKILGAVLPRVKQVLENEYPKDVHGLSIPDIREKGKATYDAIADAFHRAGEMWSGY